jgi:hypothetical protein
VLQYLEGLKDVEADQQGNRSFLLLQSSNLIFANLMISALVALTAQLEAAEKVLSKEKAGRLATDQSLAMETATRQVNDQSLSASEEAKNALAQDLQSAQASLIATTEKLTSKSSALDFVVIREREAEIKLQATEEKIKSQEQSLVSTRKVLYSREFSSSMVISLVVPNAMVLVKNHMPEFDAEILQKDFMVDDARREALVDSAYDTAQYFVSLYDFSALVESDDNASPDIL